MLKKYILIFILVGIPCLNYGQSADNSAEEEKTLNGKYRSLYNKAETYNEYKVFKISGINGLWKNVQDSIKNDKLKIANLAKEISELNQSIKDLEQRIAELESDLNQSKKEADSVTFLGMEVNETSYSVFLWSIIIGLGVLLTFLFLSHTRSRHLYLHTRKDFNALVDEFENYRKLSQDNKVKMGRELQTERNKVAELQSRLGMKDL